MATTGETLDLNEAAGKADRRCSLICRLGFTTAGVLLLLIYAIQICSPLRINPDAVDYLDLASKLTDYQPFLLDGVRPVYPIGTPLLFSVMERFRVANSAGFISLNVACLLIAVLSTASIYRSLGMTPLLASTTLIFTFSSFILIKHGGIPISDIHYMAASLSAVAMLESAELAAEKRKKFARFAIALMLVIGAVFLRRVSVALIPACLFVWRSSLRQMETLRRNVAGSRRTWIIFTAALIGVGAFALSMRSYLFYLPDFRPQLAGQRPAQLIIRLLYMRSIDLGEVLLNVPYAKLQRLHGVFPITGIMLIAILIAGMWRARRNFHPSHVYLLAYLAIMSVWPFGDSRFWLPVLPLLAAVSLQGIEPLMGRKSIRWIVASYATLYMLMFLIAAGYTTRITFSKNFPEAYANGLSESYYVQAWSNGRVDTKPARIIRRYGMR